MVNNNVDKILEATLDVVAEKKISGTRMHLISDKADMGQSNLHYYFKTKNELLIALLENIQEKFLEMRKVEIDVEKKSFNDNLRGFFKNKKDIILNDKRIDYIQFDYWVHGTVDPGIRVVLQESFNTFRNEIKKVLDKGIEVSSENDTLSYIIFSIIMGASMQFLIDENKFDLDEYFHLAEKIITCFVKVE